MTTPTALTIRVYRDSDHETVVALNGYGLAAAGVSADADVYAGDLDDVATTYLSAGAVMLVGEADRRVMAMGALRRVDDSTCEITRMRVAPEAQGRGYGKAILAALEERAHRFGYRYAVLLTGSDQHPAVDLYRASGYQVIATEQHGHLTGIRMSKRLVECPTPPSATSS
jgi:ribosomal protein S18 acetylase RimI-like enzyme